MNQTRIIGFDPRLLSRPVLLQDLIQEVCSLWVNLWLQNEPWSCSSSFRTCLWSCMGSCWRRMDPTCFMLSRGGLHQTKEDLKSKLQEDRKGNTSQYISAVLRCLLLVNNRRHYYLHIHSYYNHVTIKTYPSLVKTSLSQGSITVYNVVYQLPGYRIHAARPAGHSTTNKNQRCFSLHLQSTLPVPKPLPMPPQSTLSTTTTPTPLPMMSVIPAPVPVSQSPVKMSMMCWTPPPSSQMSAATFQMLSPRWPPLHQTSQDHVYL